MSFLLSKKKTHNTSLGTSKTKAAELELPPVVKERVDEPKSMRATIPASRLWDENRIYRLLPEDEKKVRSKSDSLKDMYAALLDAALKYKDFHGILYKEGDERRIKGQRVSFDELTSTITSTKVLKEEGEYSVAAGESVNKLVKAISDYKMSLPDSECYKKEVILLDLEDDPSVGEMAAIFSQERPDHQQKQNSQTNNILIEDPSLSAKLRSYQSSKHGGSSRYYGSTPLSFY